MQIESYNQLKKYSKLLEDKDIQNILQEMLNEYELKEIKENKDSLIVILTNKNKEEAILNITDHNLVFTSINTNNIKIKTIENGLTIEEKHYEWRQTGLIVTHLKKQYGCPIDSSSERVLLDLISKRYVVEDLKLQTIDSNIYNNWYNYSLKEILEIIKSRMGSSPLENLADLTTTFEIYHKSINDSTSNIELSDVSYETKVYLNSEDISYIYDEVTGSDAVIRIYDLYNGIINERNMADILLIRAGILSEEAFGLKEIKGITELEDDIAYFPEIETDSEYHRSIKRLFVNQLKYRREIIWSDRYALIHAIKQQDSTPEINQEILDKPPQKLLQKIFKKWNSNKQDSSN